MFWLFDWLFCWLYLDASRKAELSLILCCFDTLSGYTGLCLLTQRKLTKQKYSVFPSWEMIWSYLLKKKKCSFQRSRALHLLPVDFSSLTPCKVGSLWDMSIYTLERQAEWSASEGAGQEMKTLKGYFINSNSKFHPIHQCVCEAARNSSCHSSRWLLMIMWNGEEQFYSPIPHSAAEVWSGWFHCIVLSSKENSSNYCSVLDKLFSTRNNIYRCLTEWSVHTLIWSQWMMTV